MALPTKTAVKSAAFAITLLVASASCGRINFDPRAGAGTDDAGSDASSSEDAGPAIDAGPNIPMIVDTGSFPFRLAADENNLFWADFNDGSIHRLPIAGGPSVELAGPRLSPQVHGLALANDFVYYCDSGPGELWRVPKDGGIT